ncbi:MAG: hypothetical protein J1F32_01860 [Erysipelotrichales bacterium]|nr:hypothetical protein [Erysipelotrichales bacterium]
MCKRNIDVVIEKLSLMKKECESSNCSCCRLINSTFCEFMKRKKCEKNVLI